MKEYKLQNFILENKDVRSINYKTEIQTRLARVNSFDKGVLYRVDYYNPGTVAVDGKFPEEDKVLTVNIYYKRDNKGKVISRTTVRSYVLNANNEYGDHIKITLKSYNETEALLEGIRRRGNIYIEIYKLLNTLDTSRDDLVLFRDRVMNYFENHKAKYINLDIPINLEEVKSLDILFETEAGKAALDMVTDMLRVPPSVEYETLVGG